MICWANKPATGRKFDFYVLTSRKFDTVIDEPGPISCVCRDKDDSSNAIGVFDLKLDEVRQGMILAEISGS